MAGGQQSLGGAAAPSSAGSLFGTSANPEGPSPVPEDGVKVPLGWAGCELVQSLAHLPRVGSLAALHAYAWQ